MAEVSTYEAFVMYVERWRLQFVWWGRHELFRWPLVSWFRYEGGLARFMDWGMFIGPLEIRRWRPTRRSMGT